jgi:hypothetical protein
MTAVTTSRDMNRTDIMINQATFCMGLLMYASHLLSQFLLYLNLKPMLVP